MGLLSVFRDPTSPANIALRNFSSQWFLIPQGTGILAVVLHQLDYQFTGLIIISEIFWVYTIVLLVGGILIYLLRCCLFPRQIARELSSDIQESACLACIPTTSTTIIQMMALNLVREWGPGWGLASYILWWINIAMAVTCTTALPYVFVRYSPSGINDVSPAMNLPLISALTAAAGGGVICQYAALSDNLQVPVIIVSYLMIGMALPLALGFDTLFIARLINGSALSGIRKYQCMILCGPWGQASFALQSLGVALTRGSFDEYNKGIFLTGQPATPIGYVSIFAGLFSWGQGTFWWAFAVISLLHAAFGRRGEGLSFGLGAWSLVFPLGVYTNAAVQLGEVLDAKAFKIWSTVLAVMLVVLWLLIQVLTVRGVIVGNLLGLEYGWRRKAYINDGRGIGRGNADKDGQ